MFQSFPRFFSVSVFSILAALLLIGNSAVAFSGNQFKGTVLETMDAKNYTYMKIKTEKKNLWVAIPTTQVKVGQEVTYVRGMEMQNFESKSLGRNFESIVFSPGLEGSKKISPHGQIEKSAAPTSFADAVKNESMSPPKAQPESQKTSGSAGATVPYLETQVKKADGENSYTVGEIFDKAETLNGEKIRIRGKVVKVSPNIMGKNWIHIQDGTGDPMQNSHDLVVTTTEIAEVDQVVLVEGTMTANKDFGHGYKYNALIEEAVISK